MRLKIYSIEGQGNFGGGLTVVAATSPTEAAALANGQSSSIWNVEYKHKDAIQLDGISTKYKKPFIVAHFETGE